MVAACTLKRRTLGVTVFHFLNKTFVQSILLHYMKNILLAFVTAVASSPILYTSIFEYQTSAGAHGTLNITIVDGVGYYSWALDLNSFVIPQEAASLGCTKAVIGANGLKCKTPLN